jgi:hypothetical protein
MSYNDIRSKCLFVAYSSSKFQIGRIAERRHYAGVQALADFLQIDLVKNYPSDPLDFGNVKPSTFLNVNWALFDEDHLEHFENIGVTYEPIHSCRIWRLAKFRLTTGFSAA